MKPATEFLMSRADYNAVEAAVARMETIAIHGWPEDAVAAAAGHFIFAWRQWQLRAKAARKAKGK